jgi:putative aldouronate transport system substrate-binding protein
MNKQRSMIVVLCIIFVISIFAGCSSNTNSSNNTPAPAPAPAGDNTVKGTDTPGPDLSPVTFTISTSDDKLVWDTPITDALTEKTGVSFKYDLVVGDIHQKWNLWLAAGDYPNVVILDTENIGRYAEAGALLPLNDLIDEYGPNIKKQFGEYYNLLKDENGQIYSLYPIHKATEPRPDASANFIIQMEVLKDAGYPEVKTFDELYELIKNYVDKYPQIDGQDTIGYSAAMSGWTVNIQFNNPIISALGLPDHGNFRVYADNKVMFNPVTEEAKAYYAFLNKLYNDGLFDKEAFSLDFDGIRAKMAQGRVLAAYAPRWFASEPNALLLAEGKHNRMYASMPIYFDGVKEDHSNAITPTGAGSFQWGITKDTKNPERIIQFIDYLFTDEGQILTHWGIEGVHYDVIDGKRTVKPELTQRRIDDPDTNHKEGFTSPEGGTNNNWFSFGGGVLLSDGDYATILTKDFVRSNYDDMTKEVLAAYGKETWADFLPPVQRIPGFKWQLGEPEEVAVIQQKIDDDWRRLLPKVILSKSADEFDNEWNALVETIENHGLDEMNQAHQKLWDDFNDKYEAAIGN